MLPYVVLWEYKKIVEAVIISPDWYFLLAQRRCSPLRSDAGLVMKEVIVSINTRSSTS